MSRCLWTPVVNYTLDREPVHPSTNKTQTIIQESLNDAPLKIGD